MNPRDLLETLKLGGAQIVKEEDFLKKLGEGRPLRVKLGVDPTAPDLHLGHSVALTQLRQFQDLGHVAVLVIGDFTSMVGDPSGRSATRPILTHEQVLVNAQTYQDQAYKILDSTRSETVFNGEWFGRMNLMDVIRLNSRVTLQQMLQREDFRQRIDESLPVFLHELQYPLMQGWDSVMIRADVEIGGTDQLFNIMVGRDLQKENHLPQQVACLVPILEGLDGIQKMSKSLNNYVGLTETPAEMFGKLMSISDELMAKYYRLLLREEVPPSHPMEAKKRLASRLIARYHSESAATAALRSFELRFIERNQDAAELPEISLTGLGDDLVSAIVNVYKNVFQITKSRSEARRLIEQGSVQWRGEKITDPQAKRHFARGEVLKLDKTRSVRFSD